MLKIQNIVWDDVVTIEKAQQADLLLVNMLREDIVHRADDLPHVIKVMPGPLDATWGTAPDGSRMLVAARIPMEGFNQRDAKFLFPAPGNDIQRLEEGVLRRIKAVGRFAEPLASLDLLKAPKED
jgi:hypothetical protein